MLWKKKYSCMQLRAWKRWGLCVFIENVVLEQFEGGENLDIRISVETGPGQENIQCKYSKARACLAWTRDTGWTGDSKRKRGKGQRKVNLSTTFSFCHQPSLGQGWIFLLARLLFRQQQQSVHNKMHHGMFLQEPKCHLHSLGFLENFYSTEEGLPIRVD